MGQTTLLARQVREVSGEGGNCELLATKLSSWPRKGGLMGISSISACSMKPFVRGTNQPGEPGTEVSWDMGLSGKV